MPDLSTTSGPLPSNSRSSVSANEQPTMAVAPDGVGTTPAAAGALPVPGQTFGHYRIDRLLGGGGMGQVYEAEDLHSGRRLALKVLRRGMDNPSDRERFMREGRLAASISHPNTVYIYGSEEIAGAAVITMELAPGGTLKDKVVADGPLAPTIAVDLTLQIVAGLEAAAAAGILHRDVKPSNCFLDRSGAAKVGDFGLSISTLARDETHLTLAGTIVGTPAFASPEQMRGEALDVRADIYSVGATLYYLLTGRVPFEEANVVKLVDMVLHAQPPAPSQVRREVPRALSAVVQHALAKAPEQRYADYAELRAALEPFGPAAPVAAPIGRRLAAYVIDLAVLAVPIGLISLAWFRADPTSVFEVMVGSSARSLWMLTLARVLAPLAYFGLLEGLTGMSLGKRVCGLRVAAMDGGPPRFAAVMGRTAIWAGVLTVFKQMLSMASLVDVLGAIAVPWLPLVLTALVLFSTARRSNRFAGVHEMATGTRVVLRVSRDVVRHVASAESAAHLSLGQTRFGPYVGVELGPSDASVVTAWDEALRRLVWIRPASKAPAPAPSRRDLTRPARLRWLAGRRTKDEGWDAFESPGGVPFTAAVKEPRTWCAVRAWLHDLALEIDAGLADGTIPALELNRLWIGADGRIRLLDWPATGSRAEGDTGPARAGEKPDLRVAQTFLFRVTQAALGRPGPEEDAQSAREASVPVPSRVSQLLEDLASGRFQAMSEVAQATAGVLTGPTQVSRGQRALHVALCAVLPTVMSVGITAMMMLIAAQLTSTGPSTMELMVYLNALGRLEAATDPASIERRDALEIYVASRYRNLLTAPPKKNAVVASLPREVQATVARLRARHPNPTEAEIARATERLQPMLSDRARASAKLQQSKLGVGTLLSDSLLSIFGLMTWALEAMVAMVLAFVARGGAMLGAFGIAVVTRNGKEVSRWRALGRAAVAWLPMVAATALTFGPWRVRPAAVALAGLFFAGAAYAVVRPSRGLQDLVARTFLVPR